LATGKMGIVVRFAAQNSETPNVSDGSQDFGTPANIVDHTPEGEGHPIFRPVTARAKRYIVTLTRY
jgi:hypothetical protein